jgi:SAM-dependent methyltransferase
VQSKLQLQKPYKEAVSIGFGPAVSSPNPFLIDSIVTSFNLKGLILDIGCGVGYDCYSFSRWDLNPVGIDTNTDLLGIAKKKSNKINYLACDAKRLPFRQDVFNAIFTKGLSIFSTKDDYLCQSFIEDTMFYLRCDNPFVIILSTDLSGKSRKSTWINHNMKDVKRWCKNKISRCFFIYNIWKVPILRYFAKGVLIFNNFISTLFITINKIYKRKGYLIAVLQKPSSL